MVLLNPLDPLRGGHSTVPKILRLILIPSRRFENRWHLLVISMRAIKTEIINTTKQIGDLVDRLILHHAPLELYKPTMYIDLEGVDLCLDGSLSILTLLIDIGSQLYASVLSTCIC